MRPPFVLLLVVLAIGAGLAKNGVVQDRHLVSSSPPKGMQTLTTNTACTPTLPGDKSKVESCMAWCSLKAKTTHCARCQCKACSCAKVAAVAWRRHRLRRRRPHSSRSRRNQVSSCRKRHRAPGPATACSSGLAGDSKVASCMAWCSAKSRSTHCARCQCKACDMCKDPSSVPQHCQQQKEEDQQLGWHQLGWRG